VKHFAVALIVIALIAADFLAGVPALHVAARHARSWAFVDTLALVLAGAWFVFHRDKDDDK
jgi:hypothetical protein